jgi:hypothetical protein
MPSKRWGWVAALAVLFAGLSNAHAHVHFCFDGQEPPAAVHLADGLDHTHTHAHAHTHPENGDAHDDLDLDVPNKALAKHVKHDLPALEPLTGWTLALGRQTGAVSTYACGESPHREHRYARPPLRAPPR